MWEYAVFFAKNRFELLTVLNEHAREGWEMATVLPDITKPGELIVVFKKFQEIQRKYDEPPIKVVIDREYEDA